MVREVHLHAEAEGTEVLDCSGSHKVGWRMELPGARDTGMMHSEQRDGKMNTTAGGRIRSRRLMNSKRRLKNSI
jgi:hypothetical protein